MRWVKKIAVVVIGLLVFAIVGVWLLLSSSILATPRGNMTARFLSNELGQEIKIIGGVQIHLGSVLHVVADGLVLPSQSMTDVQLAEIGQLEFDLDLSDVLKKRIHPTNLRVDRATATLVVEQDGTLSWAMTTQDGGDTAQKPTPTKSVRDVLAGQDIQFSNSNVIYKDARNGLDLNLLLASLNLSQGDLTAPIVLKGAGTVNGQEMTLDGNFPQAQPFKVTAAFSQVSLELDGTPEPDGYQAGFSTAISVEIAELAQLLEIFKLEKSVTGTGHVKAVFKTANGEASITGLDVLVSLDTGESLILTGELGKLGDPNDVTLDTKIRLYPKDKEPAPTKSRRDLKLVAVDMVLIADPSGISKRRMVIATNGFTLDTSGVGPPPISFKEISRTPEGHLRIGKAVLRIGPPEANFMVLEGSIGDALKLQEIEVDGTLALPVASIIAPAVLQDSKVLGLISGGFHLSGNSKVLSLTGLNATSKDTDLWTMTVTGAVENTLTFSDVALDITADIPSSANLLTALDLKPIETGPIKLTTNLTSIGTKWTSKTVIAVADSHLNFSMDIDASDENPVVRGKIDSDLIKVEQVREIIAAALQFGKLDKLEKSEREQTSPADTTMTSEDGKVTEPLVLAKPGQVTDDDGTSHSEGPFRDITLLPLGRAILLSGMDLNIELNLRKIEGPKGTQSLTTDLVMKDDKARFGPVKLEYDGAHFDISGSMDLIEDPDNLKLAGSTGGWNFGELMRDLRFKKQASGILNAKFDIAGSHISFQKFLATMSGSATVSMHSGSIDTQLLDVAGLGVIPWLFSKKTGKAVTIVCLRAPLYLSNGVVSTKQTVMETDRVQLVVYGDVNFDHKTLNIVGQPRRIGKPLSRSPWPFTAVGPIAKPKIKVKDGPRRLSRSDGATTMPKRRKLCVPDILQLK